MQEIINFVYSRHRMQAKILKQDLVLFLRGSMHLHLQEDSLDPQAWARNPYHSEGVTQAMLLMTRKDVG